MFIPAWPGQVCSLGYQVGPQIERDLGITLTGEQQDRIIAYWRLDPVTGKRLVRRAAIRRPKGAGKSPEGAYCGYAELVLPAQFGRFVDGQPVGKRHHDPWIQFAAVSEDQTDNVVVWLFDTLNDRPEVCADRGIDLGRTRIYLQNRPGRMEPVTAAAGSREGQRITYAVLDQTESWYTSNGGRRLANTLRRNAAKMGGWSLELQNAPEIGDGSVADETAKAAEKQAVGVLFDTREPPGHADIDMSDPDQLRPALEFAYGESVDFDNVDIDRFIAEILDPDTDPNEARRYYLNVAAPSSDWAFDHTQWDLLGDTDNVAEPGSLVVAGFDGARHEDSTAIVAVEVGTGKAWLHDIWEKDPTDPDWSVPEAEVTASIEDLFATYDVWRLNCDPAFWTDSIAAWSARFTWNHKPVVAEFWANQWRNIGTACSELAVAIRSGAIHHQLDPARHLDHHVRNAVRRTVSARDDQGRQMWTLAKPAPGRKIDAAMALVLAWRARTEAIAAGATKRKKHRTGAF